MFLWLFLLACVGENVVRQPLGEGGVGGGAAGGSCSITGVYELTSYKCGSFDMTADFFAARSRTQISITENAISGCDVLFRWQQSGVCDESEVWSMSDPVEGESTVQFEGIDSCTPQGCAFEEEGDAACAIGDRSMVGTVAVLSNEGNTLVLENALAAKWDCALEDVTTWQR